MPETPKKEPRISKTTAALMIGTAILFDLIGLVPLVGEIMSTAGAATVFGIWFLVRGVPLISPKKLLSWGLPLVGEAIPGLSEVLPGVTIGIILMILITRTEDKLGVQVLGKKGFVNPVRNIPSAGGGKILRPQEFRREKPEPPGMNDVRAPKKNDTPEELVA